MMNKIDELLDRAFEAFNSENLRLAETLCREAMAISPTHGDALYLLGLIAYRQKALTVAADLLHEALELYPDISNYQLAFAEVLRAQGHLEEALSFYSKQMNNPKVRTEMGLIYLTQGKIKEAKDYLRTALKMNGKIASAYLGLASITTKKKEKEALLVQAYAAEANENTTYHLARFYMSQKSWKKAETTLKDYLIFSRDWTLYAGILEGLKRPDEAMKALQKAIELDAYNSNAWLQQGLLLEHQKNWEQAALSYQKALALDNTLVVAHEGLSNVLMAQGQFPVALEHTRYVIQQNPNHFPSLYKLAILLEQTEDYEEALGLYFKLLVLKPQRVGLEKRIQNAILELYKKKKHLAKKFAKGWMISFPGSEWAKKTWNLLKIVIVCFGVSFSMSAWSFDEFQDNLMWEMHYAELGDAGSQFNLGKIWEEGKMVPKSMDKAKEYYHQASRQGHIGANMALARIYEKQDGKDAAFPYYLKAAENDYAPAQLIVARYLESQGKRQEAMEWFNRALSQMFPGEKDFSRVFPEYQNLVQKMESDEFR
ncbi:MAG: tetratricopeptide repeat protein [Alphaproteobacteria bacterium]|nr:tetratricopeptide repeat protein [Alphaproteobacteria bacterium]